MHLPTRTLRRIFQNLFLVIYLLSRFNNATAFFGHASTLHHHGLCKTTDGMTGSCKHISTCPSAIGRRRDRFNSQCGYSRSNPVVCCALEIDSSFHHHGTCTAHDGSAGSCKHVDSCESALRGDMLSPSNCGFSASRPVVCCPKFDFAAHQHGPCTTAKGQPGTCQHVDKCTDKTLSIGENFLPGHCGFSDFNPVVCCPIKEVIFGAVNKPDELVVPLAADDGADQTDQVDPPTVSYTCGFRSVLSNMNRNNGGSSIRLRIASGGSSGTSGPGAGTLAIKHSWPWMVLVGRKRHDSNEFFCSGSVISDRYVITAAHCVLSPDPVFVRVGEHYYQPHPMDKMSPTAEDINCHNVTFHPKYNLNKGYHDIALMRLTKRVQWRTEVSPICLPWGSLGKQSLIGENVIVAGWGRESFGGMIAQSLRQVQVTVFDPSRCQRSYSTLKDYNRTFPDGLNEKNIVCAGSEQGKKDACQGESGGPMMSFSPLSNSYTLAGIISKGFGCGLKEFPGLYSIVRDFETLKWIKEIAF